MKQGRPVADRSLSNLEIETAFREKLRAQFYKINEKFRAEPSRTDKFRTMLVRQCRRALGEVVSLIGIDSYAKSQKIERFLPEYEKRFTRVLDVMSTSQPDLVS